ncbi:nicotinamide mononucleotide transporter [Francisella tularensis subsp. holarctica]|nr:nicotinamide mononucleotide transporter [Francisella tularensis subsp. holarctica]
MNYLYEWLIRPYHNYDAYMIYLEAIAASIGIASVICAYKRSIFVYIFGFISALIYVYLLYSWELFGDMILNCYFLLANILGFFALFKHIEKNSKTIIKIKKATVSEKNKALIIFILTVSVTPFLYAYQKNTTILNLPTYSYVDSFLTATCFSALYFQITRSINAWYLWITADIIYIPLFDYKGVGITAIQYLIFLNLVYFTLRKWQITLKRQQNTNVDNIIMLNR